MVDLRALATAAALPIALPAETRLTLLAVELDDPLAYIFESADWRSAMGAAKLIQRLSTQLDSALPKGALIISGAGDQARWVALASDLPADWGAIARLAPPITGTLTATVAGVSLTARQLFHGLYRAPTAVVGIPGMATHQGRINQYYGTAGGTTLPDAAAVSDRRHFGEALALLDHLLDQARADRDLFPSIECLPVVVRCTICRSRPAMATASTTDESTAICEICESKRASAGVIPPVNAALSIVGGRAIATDGAPVEAILRRSPTPAAYLRLSRSLLGAWAAVDSETGRALPAIPVWRTALESWWIIPTAQALSLAAVIATKFTSSVSAWSDDIARLSIQIGVGCDQAGQPDAVTTYRAARQVLEAQGRHVDRSNRRPVIGINGGWGTGNRFARYTPEMITPLEGALDRLYHVHFPAELFADLAEQIPTHTAGLYFDASRVRLNDRHRALLDAIAADLATIWGAQTDPFFYAWCDLFGLLTSLEASRTR